MINRQYVGGVLTWIVYRIYRIFHTLEWHTCRSLNWCHNERDGVSNHQPIDCLVNRLCRRRSKKTSKLCTTSLCARNSPVSGHFPAQRASNAENVSIWWRLHGRDICYSNWGPFVNLFLNKHVKKGVKCVEIQWNFVYLVTCIAYMSNGVIYCINVNLASFPIGYRSNGTFITAHFQHIVLDKSASQNVKRLSAFSKIEMINTVWYRLWIYIYIYIYIFQKKKKNFKILLKRVSLFGQSRKSVP